jgi:ribose 1,5-bisphosphokinase PhnN
MATSSEVLIGIRADISAALAEIKKLETATAAAAAPASASRASVFDDRVADRIRRVATEYEALGRSQSQAMTAAEALRESVEASVRSDAAERIKQLAPPVEAESRWAGVKEQITGIGKAALGFAVGNLGANLAMSVEERFVDAAEQVDKYGKAVLQVQRITGGTAEQSSALVAVFERFSPSVEDATTRLARFERAVAGQEDVLEVAANGGKTAAAYFREFGVQTTDATGRARPAMEILLDLADGFQRSGDAAQKNAVLTALFGRGSQSMLLMLNQGRAGLQAFIHDAERYGLVLSQESVDDVAAFVKAHKEMDMAMQGVAVQLGVTFMPLVTKLAQTFADAAKTIASTITPALHTVQDAINGLQAPLDAAITKLNTVLGAWGKIPHPNVPAAAGAAGQTALDAAISTLPVIGSVYSAGKAIAGLAGGQAAGSATAAEGTGEVGSEVAAVPAGVRAATAAEEAAKSKLQELELATAKRKADFDLAHVDAETHVLDLKMAQVTAEQSELAVKRQIEDLDRNAVDFAEKRAELDNQDAVTRAKLAEMGLSQQADEVQYQKDLLKAKIEAARAGGAPIDIASARQQMRELQKRELQMGPAMVTAEHEVRTASAGKEVADLQKSLRDTALERQKIALEEQLRPLEDELVLRQRAAQDAQAMLDLDKQRFEITEQAFKTEQLLAEVAEKAAAHTLFMLQHPAEPATVHTGPNMAGALERINNQYETGGSEAGGVRSLANAEHGNGLGGVHVTVGDVNVSVNPEAWIDQAVDAVRAKLEQAWNTVSASEPITRQLGGAHFSGAGPRW